MRKLDTNENIIRAIDNGCDVYIESYLIIKKMVDLKSEKVIKQILLKCKSMDFYSAFSDVMNMNIEELQY